MDETLSQRRIEAVFRIEWARLVAGLARFVRGDLGAAEELAQDALVAALETWRQAGIPREARGSCKSRSTPEDTDWRRIVAIYAELAATTPSPIVELNRAVAIAFADGPAAGLAIVDELANLPALAGYHLVPAVRADFLARLGRRDEAHAELERAASLTKNDRERSLLLKRAAATQN